MAIKLTQGESYTFQKINTVPVIMDGTDHAHAEKVFRNNVTISSSLNAASNNGMLKIQPDDGVTALYMQRPGNSTSPFMIMNIDGTKDSNSDNYIRFDGYNDDASSMAYGVMGIDAANGDFVLGRINSTLGADDTTGDCRLYLERDAQRLRLQGNATTYIFKMWNDGNDDDREGLRIRCGKDVNPGTSMAFIGFADGDNTGLEWILGDGSGGARFTGDAQGTYSDIRNKRDIVPMESSSRGAQAIINDIDIFEYRYNKYDWMNDETKARVDSEIRIGLSAQALESSSLAYVVRDNDDINNKIDDDNEAKLPGDYGYKYKEVDYKEIVPILIQTSKEQYAKIQELESRIAALENK